MVKALIVSSLVYTANAGVVYGIWNIDANTAGAGLFDLASYQPTTRYQLAGYQHFNTSNQYSTFNEVTREVSFFVRSLTDGYNYLYGLNVDTFTGTPTNIRFDPSKFAVLSLESSQTSNTNDLFLVMATQSTSATNSFIITKINSQTGLYTIYDTIQNYNFASAAYDSRNGVFVVIMTNTTNYVVNTYSVNGVFTGSNIYTIGNVNSNYKPTSLPYNLVYLSDFSAFYMNIDLNGRPEVFQLYAPNKQLYNRAWYQNIPWTVAQANGIGQSFKQIYSNTKVYSGNQYQQYSVNKFNGAQWTYSKLTFLQMINFWGVTTQTEAN
ncbi:hypothetical protein DICPUDRAFT_154630 [Dictyostelium purpureum]|uniref:Uncharacterized protein n=1 Tax=Dictyostelium purpureum TaxID=5786 RepID=F0ZRU5_DICPU|nr:uncharacterized protein DICPUDRAFT_154630 [Dictyostelium purpureum]EGC33323.1 hypothetical protein DICPUDRAFT_154630 [Dictyostelium purpureum]|eukprot:XP_003290139.1 hypothetical protein DICPUDRAFT_154630 [Dictyostelium purpureum]